jgi:hypothetical protein
MANESDGRQLLYANPENPAVLGKKCRFVQNRKKQEKNAK